MRYLIRLDDASEYMDEDRWTYMQLLLDKYHVKPIFGIIPHNRDPLLISSYKKNIKFWEIAKKWIGNGWTVAMHGYEHRYMTTLGGMNPVNQKSEFAGLPYNQQVEMLSKGYHLMVEHNIKPEIFFAPSHTFDENTLMALKTATPIRIVCDTVATDVYKHQDLYFIPQQCGALRNLPFNIVVGCYHPNTMGEKDFEKLENFICKNYDKMGKFNMVLMKNRKYNMKDELFRKLYFFYKNVRDYKISSWHK